MRLGLNIDHIATLREARKIHEPDPLEAVFIAKNMGVDLITLHLREDRRHIHEDDVKSILKHAPLPINAECAIDPEITQILCTLKPFKVTLVPERRAEITTEGGLNLQHPKLQDTIKAYADCGIEVALFIDPSLENLDRALELGVKIVELHTGKFSNLFNTLYTGFKRHKNRLNFPESNATLQNMLKQSLEELAQSALKGQEMGLEVCAGHGLNYASVRLVAKLKGISELNIGHAIIARAVIVGLDRAIGAMQEAMRAS
ncbi:Pyridoxine 5'-phosphate synthase PdxJ [Helicobacter sp. NHP19-003]|uniref:Pyridoxine 5'-phosphate synthase n=1 Tax=Helicobacter gastrocanis TaxID=2849641 RepID=A0ABM7SEF8_9HELI|nr:pyridoxine 5'-phosphate synthase [Helicobacter sp. NHP19-003]BCZ18212.1 Pyridoxine 5'-phosphate synthase PdxJ [Helicobacter sp. NHP19-003]